MAQPPINLQIKRLRKKLALNQINFAKRAGVGLRFLRELEEGKPTIRLDKLNQVLDFLGVHLELARNESTGFESETVEKAIFQRSIQVRSETTHARVLQQSQSKDNSKSVTDYERT